MRFDKNAIYYGSISLDTLISLYGDNIHFIDAMGANLITGFALHKNKKFVRKLIEQNVDINQLDELGHSALQTALMRNDVQFAKFLIKMGADINKDYKNALHWSKIYEAGKSVDFLIKFFN